MRGVPDLLAGDTDGHGRTTEADTDKEEDEGEDEDGSDAEECHASVDGDEVEVQPESRGGKDGSDVQSEPGEGRSKAI